MFFHLLFIHLFRPFLKYKQASSPLPVHVSPRKFLTHAASMISKLLRLYKRTHGLRQICNIVVYISHSACTIHLLNLPDKNAARDIVHGLKNLEEIGDNWICARRTLGILQLVTRRWSIELPEEAEKTFLRAETKFGPFKEHEASAKIEIPPPTPMQPLPPATLNHSPQHDHHQRVQSANGLSSSDLYPNGINVSSPMTSPDMSQSDGSLIFQPNSAAELNKLSSEQNYTLPHAQQQQQQGVWKHHQIPRPPVPPTTSPTMLFGGVQSLMQDQEWWLRDSNQLLANWNGLEHDAMIHGNGGFDLGTGNLGYANGGVPTGYMNGSGNGAFGM